MKIFSSFLALTTAVNSRSRPNVILLNCDDFGIGDFQIYNREAKVPTPNIDRLGKEGVKFMSAHSGSSRCSPSRYMLMTGRYSMEDSPTRKLKGDEPHLGAMFKKAGYKTALFGKNQPLPSWPINLNETRTQREERKRLNEEFDDRIEELGYRLQPGNDFPGIYRKQNPAEYGYDYSFLNSALCCQPGGYYENGEGIEPMDTFLRQLPYPETLPRGTEIFNPENGACPMFPYSGYMGPDQHEEKYTGDILDLSIYFCNYAIETVAMKSYDSRHSEEKIIPKLEKFIDDNKDEDFFVYYGMRSGHGPFNTPIRFRNQTQAGSLGEMIMEADEIVGKILARLEANGIADDTLVMFMSDNGPNSSADLINEALGHNQRRLDLPKRSVVLPGRKNGHDEGGHRTPFLWRYPNRFPPRNIYDPKVPVSTVDIYATLAELIQYDLECNEAPDSRSIVSYLETGEASREVQLKPIMTHANIRGNTASLRHKHIKFVPESQELFNLKLDPETKNNLFFDKDKERLKDRLDMYLKDWLDHIEEREIATEKGRDTDNCYPEFKRFKHLNL